MCQLHFCWIYESALTILNKNIWDKCKQPGDYLEPWNEQSLTLRVYGSACVQWKVDGMVFSHSVVFVVVVVEPLGTEAMYVGLDFWKVV